MSDVGMSGMFEEIGGLEMATYKVMLKETQTYEFEIDGENKEEAENLAYQAWVYGELGYAGLDVDIELEEA